jgi:hypothetical protein
MRPHTIAIAVGLVALAIAPFASAAANGCAVYSPVPFQWGPYLQVPGPYLGILGAPASCGGGRTFNNPTGACPLFNTAPAVGPGEYCGSYMTVLPNATVTCAATHPAGFEALVVGLDHLGTGNIGNVLPQFPGNLVYDGVFYSHHSATITNIGGPATVIAYPVGTNANTPVLVSCV